VQDNDSLTKKATGSSSTAGGSSNASGSSTAKLSSARKRKANEQVTSEAPKRLKQASFQVYSGVDMPFTDSQIHEIEKQVLRATISANIPFIAWENPEMKKLFHLIRSTSVAILPSRKVVSSRLLDDAAQRAENKVGRALQGRSIGLWYAIELKWFNNLHPHSSSDGWKSRKKADLNAVCANADFKVRLQAHSSLGILLKNSRKTYTLELVNLTSQSKDGPGLCNFFGATIDRVEEKFSCWVIFFTTDADGGSKKGRVLLGKERPWLLVPSCWAHQVCANSLM
jgi:hypothetical protein